MKHATARKLFKIKLLSALIVLTLGHANPAFSSDDIQFNMDVLDVNDRKNVDLSQFSRQ